MVNCAVLISSVLYVMSCVISCHLTKFECVRGRSSLVHTVSVDYCSRSVDLGTVVKSSSVHVFFVTQQYWYFGRLECHVNFILRLTGLHVRRILIAAEASDP